jgi:uncharacterized protein YeaO (DUF488 family)
MTVRLKRAYAPAEAADGFRILVDRLWPRGMTKEQLHVDAWMKELAPSAQLRKWFGHDPARWQGFTARYRAELEVPPARPLLDELRRRAQRQTLTLVFAARDEEHNNARVLADILGSPGRGRPRTG